MKLSLENSSHLISWFDFNQWIIIHSKILREATLEATPNNLKAHRNSVIQETREVYVIARVADKWKRLILYEYGYGFIVYLYTWWYNNIITASCIVPIYSDSLILDSRQSSALHYRDNSEYNHLITIGYVIKVNFSCCVLECRDFWEKAYIETVANRIRGRFAFWLVILRLNAIWLKKIQNLYKYFFFIVEFLVVLLQPTCFSPTRP